MNTTIKLGIATALSLGAMGAHASIASNSSGSSTVILFAEVLNSSGTLIASYAENTGVSVTSAYNGITTFIAADAGLSALFAADVSGDTLVWGVEGGQYTGTNTANGQSAVGATKNVSTAANSAIITGKTSGALFNQNTALSNAITALNTNLGSNASVEGPASASAGVWDTTGGNQIYNWGGNGPGSNITGVGTAALYDMTGTGSATGHLALVTNTSVTLSSSGLQFTNTGAAPVPLPAAFWLLGSGLLGLAGVGRRKAKA
jgi:hypothetical protein